MFLEKYLDTMRNIQENLLVFLEDDSNTEENFQNLLKILDDQRINENRQNFKLLLHLIVKISKNHHRGPNFFSKIEKILRNFKIDIGKYFSNIDIFKIFKSNKRLLLFLHEEQIMKIDGQIAQIIITGKKYQSKEYPQYFAPEIKPFINEGWFPEKVNIEKKDNKFKFFFNKRQIKMIDYMNERRNKMIDYMNERHNDLIDFISNDLPDNFYENRKNGENENELCKIIQKDLIKEFIAYVNKNNISLNKIIDSSIFETNSLLFKFPKYGVSLN